MTRTGERGPCHRACSEPSATIASVSRYRGLALLTLGFWIGVAVLGDIAVTQNFQTVDRFLANPGTPAAAVAIGQMGPAPVRALLRRNAGEENNYLFANIELAEMTLCAIGAVLLARAGELPRSRNVGLGAVLTVVLAQHFWLTPRIAELGRTIDGLPASNALVSTFWTLHGVYSGLELLKLAVLIGLSLWLALTPSKEAHGR